MIENEMEGVDAELLERVQAEDHVQRKCRDSRDTWEAVGLSQTESLFHKEIGSLEYEMFQPGFFPHLKHLLQGDHR